MKNYTEKLFISAPICSRNTPFREQNIQNNHILSSETLFTTETPFITYKAHSVRDFAATELPGNCN